jgi:tRNA(His) 5'-end guanylyltransferase
MSKDTKDSLGARMKSYEHVTTSLRAFKGQPLICRLDGKAFHTFCRGLVRPYDERLSSMMRDTMLALVDHFQARVGYTQSDEISLVWYMPVNDPGEYMYDGRFQKYESLLAAFATAFFNKQLAKMLPEKAHLMPLFDCRAWVVPTLIEAYNTILWRQQDAVKNAISMAAQSMFSHASLQGVPGYAMQERMWTEKQVNFNDYPAFFKRGIFGRRVNIQKQLTADDLAKIPPAHRPVDEYVSRPVVVAFDEWLGQTITTPEELFNISSI